MMDSAPKDPDLWITAPSVVGSPPPFAIQRDKYSGRNIYVNGDVPETKAPRAAP